jgi:predicted dehydrogenase
VIGAMIIGLGSMGRRRMRLLEKAFPGAELLGVDTNADRRDSVAGHFGGRVYSSIGEALSRAAPSVAFVCTSPATHHEIILGCLRRKLHVFTELNLLNEGYDELQALAKSTKSTLFLSSTLLYRRDVSYIAERVHGRRVNYMYHAGLYLPDWHPWEDYRNFFVGDKRTNGCREIFAIDLPWILDAFGPVSGFSTLKDKRSSLEIDYDDNYIVTFEHANGAKGVLCVDVICRKAMRHLEVFSEDLHLFWEGSPSTLFEYDIEKKSMRRIETYETVERDANYNETIIEDAYAAEIAAFFAEIEGTGIPRYTFADDARTLALIDRIEGKNA